MLPRREHILVTGAGGFVGSHLLQALKAQGREVLGLGRRAGPGVRAVNVLDRSALFEEVAAFKPDGVVHLAAIMYLPEVLSRIELSSAVNVLGTLNLLEALRAGAPKARLILVSSCVVYGDPLPSSLPLREDSPLDSWHPYGVQKITAELLGKRFCALGLDVVIARPFNHVGPGMDARISLMHFALQIAAAEAGVQQPLLKVGNLASARDFLHVDDVVDAYIRLLDHERPPSPVNICRGRSTSIREALEGLLRLSPLRFRLAEDPARLRKKDVAELYGDSSRLRAATNWEPKIGQGEMLKSILVDARRRRGAADSS